MDTVDVLLSMIDAWAKRLELVGDIEVVGDVIDEMKCNGFFEVLPLPQYAKLCERYGCDSLILRMSERTKEN